MPHRPTWPGCGGENARLDGRGPSRTAGSAAHHRAAHQVLEMGAMFRDPTAAVTIAGRPAEDVAGDARAHPDRTPMRLLIAARHARGDEGSPRPWSAAPARS
jgi:hypothetical protein